MSKSSDVCPASPWTGGGLGSLRSTPRNCLDMEVFIKTHSPGSQAEETAGRGTQINAVNEPARETSAQRRVFILSTPFRADGRAALGWEQPSWCPRSGQSKIISNINTSVGGREHTGHFRSTHRAGALPALPWDPPQGWTIDEPILPEAPDLFVLRCESRPLALGEALFSLSSNKTGRKPPSYLSFFQGGKKAHGHGRPGSSSCLSRPALTQDHRHLLTGSPHCSLLCWPH